MDEKEFPKYTHNRNLKKKCGLGLVLAMILTLSLHAFGTEMLWSPHNLASGKTFEDYESFVAYMEQDIPYGSETYRTGLFTSAQDSVSVPLDPDSSFTEEQTWYDEYGNEITEEEALTRTLCDANGNVVCTYLERNRSVVSLRYDPKDGTVLPITAITDNVFRSATSLSQLITWSFCLLYPVEVLAVIVIYLRRRMV